MEENQTNYCETCKHFRQHYVRVGNGSFMPIHDGHCVHPRLKQRTTDTPACQRYCAKKSASTP